jgi:hypothetical protein
VLHSHNNFFGRLYCFGGLEPLESRRFATPDRIDPKHRVSPISQKRNGPAETKKAAASPPRPFENCPSIPGEYQLWSPPSDEDEPHDGAGLGAGLGAAQLAAGAGSGAGAGAGAALGAAAFFGALFLGALFFAAFLADFFGAAFLADFFADFLATFLADFLAVFFEDFFADFFFAITDFLAFLAFLLFLLFFALAIVILLFAADRFSSSQRSFERRPCMRCQSIS